PPRPAGGNEGAGGAGSAAPATVPGRQAGRRRPARGRRPAAGPGPRRGRAGGVDVGGPGAAQPARDGHEELMRGRGADMDYSAMPRFPGASSGLPTEIPCQGCGRPAYGIRCYSLVTVWFLLVWVAVSFQDVSDCPRCARKALLKRTLLNLLTA